MYISRLTVKKKNGWNVANIYMYSLNNYYIFKKKIQNNIVNSAFVILGNIEPQH